MSERRVDGLTQPDLPLKQTTRTRAQYKGSRLGQARRCKANPHVDQILPEVDRINGAGDGRIQVLTESENSQMTLNLSASSLSMRPVPSAVKATT